jgi:hypothetical protein
MKTRSNATPEEVSISMSLDVPYPVLRQIAEMAAEIAFERMRETTPLWGTLEDAAIRYRSTPGALRKRAQRGQLPGAVRDGGRWLVDMAVLDAALKADGKIVESRNGASAASTAPPPGTRR